MAVAMPYFSMSFSRRVGSGVGVDVGVLVGSGVEVGTVGVKVGGAVVGVFSRTSRGEQASSMDARSKAPDVTDATLRKSRREIEWLGRFVMGK
jgi:hypothetical protein